ncbi:hypothetical protein ncot_15210 [Nocardioides sp. JQ2195]|uniref:hypothetical protein n=1 Tax=Nocardioides sp. JQ2195 TaxID=2592334 RepID=UPI00143E6EB3|nr:hypothetical protein [Nocardioides sp. JQ2195]QIX27788.1 hypothetical protein ncot_15210 [Nocardioides sp. JQ2195]
MRFHQELQRLAAELTLAGHVVLAPTPLAPAASATVPALGEPSPEELTVEERARLGRIHLQKVAMADEVLVVNVGGHVGESTTHEIEHAVSLGIPVRYLEPHAPDGADD